MSSSTSSGSFKLSVQLQGHTQDVRAVSTLKKHAAATASSFILSASRDESARIWPRHGAPTRAYETPLRLSGHTGFVNAAKWLEDASGNVYALTAGQDKLANAYTVQITPDGSHVSSSPTPDFILIGHENNICAIDSAPDGSYIVTGSWDLTARVWKDWNCVATLSGHSQSVWAVLALDQNRVLTASADKMIRLFDITRPDKPIAIFSGHTDAVRGLTRLADGAGFASCGNDGTINLYAIPDGPASGPIRPQATLSGHTSFVYSLAVLPSGELVSSGEDRSVRIWRDGALVQTITIPAISVWSVDTLPNGDIACGSSDGWVRVFTRDASRVADADELAAYEHTVSSQALNKTQVGDVKTEDLPGKEELSKPGTKEGQVKMIKAGKLVEAYQWTLGSWEKIGEVVGGVGSGQKKLFEGKEYDYVFDVDIADGVPPLKLPYNLSEDPYMAANAFLLRNELPTTYIDQVVKFIEQNTEAVNLGPQERWVDPYSEGRYVPGSGPQQGAPTQLTGGGGGVGLNFDPYTSSQANAGPAILPQRECLSFKQVKFEPLKAKLAQLNGELQGTASQLSPADLEALNTTLTTLETSLSSKATFPLSVAVLESALSRWPPSHRLPLLDAYRLAILVPSTTPAGEMVRNAIDTAQLVEPWPPAGDAARVKERDTNALLGLRAVANAFSAPGGKESVVKDAEDILASLRKSGAAKNLSKNGRIALATVLLNFAVHAQEQSTAQRYATRLLELFTELLQSEKDKRESEVLFRSLVGLGTLLLSNSAGSLPVGAVAAAKQAASAAAGKVGEERISKVEQEVQRAG